MKPITGRYEILCFASQLKKIRLYRGFKTQSGICKELKILPQSWNQWERGLRFPEPVNLVSLANYLNVEMNYFFLADGIPEKFDLGADSGKT